MPTQSEMFKLPLPAMPSSKSSRRKLIKIPNRGLVAQDSARPSIAVLGHDLLVVVLQALHDTHPTSMTNVKQVSSTFHHLAEYIACNTLKLDLTSKASGQTSERLFDIENRGLLAAIRNIEVTAAEHEPPDSSRPGNGGYAAKGQSDRPEEILRSLLPLMTGLKDLHWPTESMSSATLTLLKDRPVRLHVKTNSYRHKALKCLIDCPNLHSLSVHQDYTSAEDCLQITKPLKAVLLSCTKLRKLSLDISMPRSGCVVYSMPHEYCGMGFVKGEKPPTLESLSVHGYLFGFAETSGEGVFGGTGPSFQAYGGQSEQDYWIQNFDWSQLKVLEVNDAKLALGLMSKLPKLEEVGLKRVYPPEAIQQFYLEVPTALQTIEVPKLESIGLGGILRHGSALRKLQLHQNESYNKIWKDEAIDNASLIRIRDECPLIEDLQLDLGRSGEWPFDVLNTIASFPRLRKLTIWFKLGMGKDVDLAAPKVMFSAVEMLFQHLRQRSRTQPSKLRELHVYSGSPPGIGHGYPSPMAFWPEHNSMHFRCLLSERDDEAARGSYRAECPRLGKQANEYLRGECEAFKPGEGYAHLHDTERVEVAKNGPKARDEWKAHY